MLCLEISSEEPQKIIFQIVEGGHAERNTRRVILLTLVIMIIEITAGYIFGSMALLADGWHMGNHAAA